MKRKRHILVILWLIIVPSSIFFIKSLFNFLKIVKEAFYKVNTDKIISDFDLLIIYLENINFKFNDVVFQYFLWTIFFTILNIVFIYFIIREIKK